MLKLMHVPKTPAFLRMVDFFMIPVMFVLGGFRRDSMQETHPWHVFRGFEAGDINRELAVASRGDDTDGFQRHLLFLFHAPIFGGWKNYSVLAPKEPVSEFRIGWLVYHAETGELIEKGVNKLPVTNGAIRLLNGPPYYSSHFFAVDAEGKQVAMQKTGQGRLGDGKNPGVRLF